MALLMVMTVGLLGYAAALEYRVRQAPAQAQTTARGQQGNPTASPTVRWVFQLFTGIRVLLIGGPATMVLSLKPPQQV